MKKTEKVGYVDGFVLIVPIKNRGTYIEMAKGAGKMWIKCGALGYFESVGDDFNAVGAGEMKGMAFPDLTKIKSGETVWFSYITYRSRAHRDQVNKKVNVKIAKIDPKVRDMNLHFDLGRMAFGGFKVEVDLLGE